MKFKAEKCFEIHVRHDARRRAVSCRQIMRSAEKILRRMGCRSAEISVLLTSDRKIRALNRKYLRHDRSTDVITFGFGPAGRFSVGLPRPFLGDVVISVDTARRQAAEQQHGLAYELYFLLCHGILHLLGWTDSTHAKSQKMMQEQQKILAAIGIRNQTS